MAAAQANGGGYVDDFLVEVGVTRRGEKLPAGFLCVDKTPSGQHANLNKGFRVASVLYFVARRGLGPDKDPMVVTDVTVVTYGSDPVPHGFEVVTLTVGGNSANLNKGSGGHTLYLCVKKGRRDQVDKAVYDICVIRPRKGDEVPADYIKINKNLNEGSVGENIFLCVRYLPIRHAAVQAASAQPQGTPQPVGAPNGPFPRQTSEREQNLSGVMVSIRPDFVIDQGNMSIDPIPIQPTMTRDEIDRKYSYLFEVERGVVQSAC